MKTQRYLALIIAASAVATSAAYAADKFRGDGGDNWIEHVRQTPSAANANANKDALLYGSPAPVSQATRTITLKPGMKYVNVDSGETVAFNSDNGPIAWTFIEAMQRTSANLGVLLPDTKEAQGVYVIISRSKWMMGS
ncbi:CzcE family metal-binding protein [Ralstonia mannitolilytica]|uniref:CzcE family metal-binding protein n=1 Tax=Ralstonia mannitolilytica TaxID=105219 RepID=UPI0007B011E0|nr:CzcE family metal-binding protein [Ralstonia mannitolilytica]ANA35757.1 hypothetical protein VZ52_20390 [Ralstonia mannitolilytica]MBU9580850.1 CzcE family metal-binding protein [Ralstonia mannitolilytica]CAJ0687032.1 hypothetical protein R82526_02913 [Ralstonia mannitolilytica]CAJ0804577.1 hypothetical protein R77555_04147 [Ralstonia mannitolilytica]CAJ0856026.1 hypothetical protein R76727_01036 [Ralstonia mannitolilytica]